MARSDVHPVHRFDPWQVWPGSYKTILNLTVCTPAPRDRTSL